MTRARVAATLVVMAFLWMTVSITLIETADVTAGSNPTSETDYFHNGAPCTINGIDTYCQIFNTNSTMGVGYVASGAPSVSIMLFRSESFPGQIYLNGTQTITFYMNSNSSRSSGTYRACLDYVTPPYTVLLGCPPEENITLPSGSGNVPFTAYSFTETFSNQSIPTGAVLAVALTVTDPGHTVYILWDSTNGMSNIQLDYLLPPTNTTTTTTTTASVTQSATTTVTTTHTVTSTITVTTAETVTGSGTTVTSTQTTTVTTTQTTTSTTQVSSVPTWAYGTMVVLLIVGLVVGYIIKRPSVSKP